MRWSILKTLLSGSGVLQKPSEEARREQLFLDDVIHKAHFEREIRARLEGVETALDVGAGTGRFSLWLAARRVRVTHLDVSARMIERAHRDAVEAGVAERMTFRQGRLADIGGYEPGQFDLVICSDAPVSYVYPEHAPAIQSLARDLLHDRHGVLADERDRHRVGADAVARDAAGGVEGVEARQLGWLGRGLRVRSMKRSFLGRAGIEVIAGAARIVIIGRGGG